MRKIYKKVEILRIDLGNFVRQRKKNLARRGKIFIISPRQIHRLMRHGGLLAQVVEQWTFNPLVEGSSPSQPTRAQRM